jgi:SAM-dependent methyltransferase
VCHYHGRFKTLTPETGIRRHAECPKCGALERHRLQHLVLEQLSRQYDFSRMRMLHFAPEPFFQPYFKNRMKEYKTADLFVPEVDYRVDITQLPFDDEEYDFVFASHVLEHIVDDCAAVSEVRRVLSPSGIALLPVPIVSLETIEYPAPNPSESDHVRAPGFDYFDRYRRFFSTVNVYTSSDFPPEYQTYVYEDRSRFPNRDNPLRKAIPGERHIDVVPVCLP